MRVLEDALWPLLDSLKTVQDGQVRKAYVVLVLLLVGLRAREGNGTSFVDQFTGAGAFCKENQRVWKTFMTIL